MTQLRRKPEVDYYKVLQVDADAEPEVIEAAYRALSKKYHPDVNRASDSEDRMARINSAYTTLSDPAKRRDYNQLRASQSQTRTAAPTPSPAARSASVTRAASPAATAAHKAATAAATSETSRSGSATFNPSSATQNPTRPAGQTATSSFRPQPPPASNPAQPAGGGAPAANRTVPNYDTGRRRVRPVVWLTGVVAAVALLAGGMLGAETLLGNPLKTTFIKQPAATTVAAAPPTARAPGQTTPAVVGPAATTAVPQAAPASRETVSAFLNNAELYAGRLGDVGLTSPDVLQLRVRLAANGTVLNSESPPPGRSPDELDVLRQSEATTYNLVYTLFGRFQELNRINLTLTDSKDKAVYRADVARQAAFTFYSWHSNFNYNDPAEAIKSARQDRLSMHFGVLLDEGLRARLLAPSESNIQAELQSIGLSAFTVTGGQQFSINYAQVRSQAEIAVDFSRIIYTLYTRFPALDRLQIVLFSSPERPVKVIDRPTFNQIALESWSQASYGGAGAGGDRQAQTIIAALPGNWTEIKPLPVPAQVKYKTPAQIGNWAVVAENVERLENLTLENQRFPAGKDRQYLLVKVALRNFSDGREWLMPGEKMSLVDLRGQTYYSDPAATLLYVLKTPPGQEPPPGPIEANKQGAIYVAFNVPANINLSTLRLQFQDGDKRAYLELS